MVFGLLKSAPVLEAESEEAVFNVFEWALRHLDGAKLGGERILVTPSNEHFPGRVDSVQAMAELMFGQVQHFAGADAWSFRVVDEQQWIAEAESATPSLAVVGATALQADDMPPLAVPYSANQLSNPEGLIATFAQIVAHYVAQAATEPPPGGKEDWPMAMELLAIYLGFGVMFANSALNVKTGCGSCHVPGSERSAYLSESDATYALALFAQLHGVSTSAVTRHLKSSLRGRYKGCVKQVQANSERLTQLQALL
jgi:hypothetical protein